jgi:hypothetical protein
MATFKYLCYLQFKPVAEVSGTSPRQVGPAGDFYIRFKVAFFGEVVVFSYPLVGLYFRKSDRLFFIC